MSDVLPDVLARGLAVVFCGTAAGARSAQVRAYYAGPGNKFYGVLHEVGLTPGRMQPEAFGGLIEHGIGLTDLVKRSSGGDASLAAKDYDVPGFKAKIEAHAPRFVCFNGKKASQTFFDRKDVGYGLQDSCIGQTRLFVAPSTSGAANGYWDVAHWHTLGRLIRETR